MVFLIGSNVHGSPVFQAEFNLPPCPRLGGIRSWKISDLYKNLTYLGHMTVWPLSRVAL